MGTVSCSGGLGEWALFHVVEGKENGHCFM